MTMLNGLPNVLDYTDFRTYLSDWESFQRRTKPHFSHQWIQKTAKLGSRSHFLSVTKGRALSPLYIDRYVQLLQLNSEEEKHFRLLVQFDNSKEETERKGIWNQLVQNSPRLRPLQLNQGNQLGLFSSWILFPLLSLLEIVPHERNPQTLAEYFLPELTSAQISEALETLQELGFLKFDLDAKHWIITHKFIESTSQESKDALFHWQSQWLHLGQWIQTNREIQQNLSTLTIGFSESSRPKILGILNQARKEILNVVRADQNPTAVHQLNLHLFQIVSPSTEGNP